MHPATRTALVLGIRGGIGRKTAAALVAEGFRVHGVDRAEAPPGRGDDGAVVWRYDLAGPEAGHRLRAYLREYGPPDALVWSVGVYDRRELPDYGEPRVREVLDTNLTALLIVLREVVVEAWRRGSPLRIAVVGSQAGASGGADPVYAAAKAGCAAAVKSVAREYARAGVRANVVSPGPVNTTMADVMGPRRGHYEDAIPLGRFAEPEEVASVIVWLLTRAPAALTGAVIDVDGGLLRR
jgi:3-oxoacyl-[acyl-carrier protein] reductase